MGSFKNETNPQLTILSVLAIIQIIMTRQAVLKMLRNQFKMMLLMLAANLWMVALKKVSNRKYSLPTAHSLFQLLTILQLLESQ